MSATWMLLFNENKIHRIVFSFNNFSQVMLNPFLLHMKILTTLICCQFACHLKSYTATLFSFQFARRIVTA